MGKIYTELSESLCNFITQQKLFFVGTARSTGSVSVSPKGMDTFRIINSKQIVWLNLTGSGNETAAHLLENDRMTIMFCAFEGKPLILRLYGKAKIYHKEDTIYIKHSTLFPNYLGARQIIVLNIDKVQTSCGFGVPFMNFKGERTQLEKWSKNKGKEKIKQYWKDRNSKSIDGFETR